MIKQSDENWLDVIVIITLFHSSFSTDQVIAPVHCLGGAVLIGVNVLQEHEGVVEIKEEYDPDQDFGGRKKGGWGMSSSFLKI